MVIRDLIVGIGARSGTTRVEDPDPDPLGDGAQHRQHRQRVVHVGVGRQRPRGAADRVVGPLLAHRRDHVVVDPQVIEAERFGRLRDPGHGLGSVAGLPEPLVPDLYAELHAPWSHTPGDRLCGPAGRCAARGSQDGHMAPPTDDTTDFEDAERGFIGAMVPCVVTADDGRVVWDNDAYAFLDGDCPDTANPSLWRQSQLVRQAGPVRGHRRHLPGARPRPLEHDAGRGRRGRDRDRPAHLQGDRGRGPRPVPRRTAATGRSRRSSTPTPTATTSAASTASTATASRSSPATGSWRPRSPRTSTPARP